METKQNLCLPALLPSTMEYTFFSQFREGLAPTWNGAGWFHIRLDRVPAYSEVFDWVGPFVEGLSPVEKDGKAYHIGPNGKPAYPYRFDKVGIFSYVITWGWIAWAKKGGRFFFIYPDGTEVEL